MKKYTVVTMLSIASAIEFCLGRYEQCQCFLLLTLLGYNVLNDIKKK